MKHTIYRLIDPRDSSSRYVGRTTRPLRIRLSGHLSHPTSCIREWIAELKALGLKPVIEALEDVDDIELAESKWIHRLTQQGEPLLNRVQRNYGWYRPAPGTALYDPAFIRRMEELHPDATVSIGHPCTPKRPHTSQTAAMRAGQGE